MEEAPPVGDALLDRPPELLWALLVATGVLGAPELLLDLLAPALAAPDGLQDRGKRPARGDRLSVTPKLSLDAPELAVEPRTLRCPGRALRLAELGDSLDDVLDQVVGEDLLGEGVDHGGIETLHRRRRPVGAQPVPADPMRRANVVVPGLRSPARPLRGVHRPGADRALEHRAQEVWHPVADAGRPTSLPAVERRYSARVQSRRARAARHRSSGTMRSAGSSRMSHSDAGTSCFTFVPPRSTHRVLPQTTRLAAIIRRPRAPGRSASRGHPP